MLISMTGFSTKTFQIRVHGHAINATATLRSINARFFETTIKLPHALAFIEHELVKMLKSRLHRGTITFSLSIGQLASLKGPVQLATTTVESYLKACKDLQDRFHIPGTVTINDLLHLDTIFELPETQLSSETSDDILQAASQMIDELIIERKREGAQLEQDIMARINKMRSFLALIEPRANEIVQERKKELTKAIHEVTPTISDEQRNHHLLVLLQTLDRLDVHEEITRLKAHFENFIICIQSAELEKGRKLDFITQEVLREYNTLASKLPDTRISAWVIEAKVELEKIREQAQNIV